MTKSLLTKSCNKYIAILEEALKLNRYCRAGLFASPRAYILPKRNGQEFEALTLIHLSADAGYWYGYIGVSIEDDKKYVALILRLNHFLNADNVEMLLGLFNQFTVGLSAYYPCKIQHPDDAFAKAESFPKAVEALAEMIKRFDPDKRDPTISSSHYMDSYELRIFDFLGFRRSF